MKFKKNTLNIFLAALIALQSCRYHGLLQDKIVKAADDCTSYKNNCIIDLKTLTSFDWDRLYIFEEYVDPEKMGKEFGFKYTGEELVPDECSMMIFTKDSSVVYKEVYSWKSKLQDIPLPIDTTSYSPEKDIYTNQLPYLESKDAKFGVIKNKGSHNYFYSLYLIKDLGKAAQTTN